MRRGLRRTARAAVAALLGRAPERTSACPTNTQCVLQLAGYRWAAAAFGGPGLRAVDVASGAGFGTAVLAGAGMSAIGVDIDIETLRASARRWGPGRWVCADGTRLPVRTASAQLVISQDTLEHVADDLAFVRELARVTAGDGVCVVTTPRAERHTERPRHPWHVREYSAASLRALLERSFARVELWTRRRGPRLEAAEHAMGLARRWDPLGLRRWVVPARLRHRLVFAPGEDGDTLIAVCLAPMAQPARES